MEIRPDVAALLVENIEMFLNIDNIMDDEKFAESQDRVFALQLMLEDILRQEGRLPEMTEDARKIRTACPFYLAP
jgi:hypothetical protein